jgi:hypothetical protein
MSWFVIEILVALAPVGMLLWWTVRMMRRRHPQQDEAQANASASEGDRP